MERRTYLFIVIFLSALVVASYFFLAHVHKDPSDSSRHLRNATKVPIRSKRQVFGFFGFYISPVYFRYARLYSSFALYSARLLAFQRALTIRRLRSRPLIIYVNNDYYADNYYDNYYYGGQGGVGGSSYGGAGGGGSYDSYNYNYRFNRLKKRSFRAQIRRGRSAFRRRRRLRARRKYRTRAHR